MTEEKPQYQRVKIAGMWENTTASGIKYLSGTLNNSGLQIQVWPNKKRDGKKDPDFILYFSEKQKVAHESKINVDNFEIPKDGAVDYVDVPF